MLTQTHKVLLVLISGALLFGSLIFGGVQTYRLMEYQRQDREWSEQQKKLQDQRLLDDEKEQQARENGCIDLLQRTSYALSKWTYPPQCQYITQPYKDYIAKIQSEGYCKTHTRDDAILLLHPMLNKANLDFYRCDVMITNMQKHNP